MRCLLALIIGLWSVSAPAGQVVNESAREIPLAYNVDVVVVGGSTGAVSAAIAAAESGAKVFLAAPHPYLGDDMTATLRLWLESGEEPTSTLAKRLFNDPVQPDVFPDPNRLPFRYEADQPCAATHKDTKPPKLLNDGLWGDASRFSVQYDSDVTITADLGKPTEIAGVRIGTYYRDAGSKGSSFKVESITISTSDDKQSWQEAAVIKNTSVEEQSLLSAPVQAKARYVKLAVKKTADATRVLLGEIEILKPAAAIAVDPAARPMPRPMHIKKTLDEALLAAGVQYLYGCYATDVLRDGAGRPCGIVMANRAGRQAIVARTIIDATERATVARLAGAKFSPYPTGTQTFKRVVIGGEICSGEGMTARTVDPPFRGQLMKYAKNPTGFYQVIEYTLELPMPDDGWASWAKADQLARTKTYHPEQQFTSDVLFQVPPDAMQGQQQASGEWQGVEPLPLGAFRPAGVDHLFVVGGCADVSRGQAEKLLRPLALIDLGARLGKAAAQEAAARSAPAQVTLPGTPAVSPATGGDVGELLVGVRPIQKLSTIPQAASSLPVLGTYDVVVVGGGTGGAPAGIGAGRQGAKTLVVEYLQSLGGVGTVGAISSYYWGNRIGFSATVEDGKTTWVIEQRAEWWRSHLLETGADLWYATIGCGALVEKGCVKGVVVATPLGRGVVLAKTVIDTTGNSDIAAAAGAQSYYTDESEMAMQGTGLPPRMLGATYTNTDFTITDETDLVDMWHLFVYSKNKYAKAFDHGQLIDTRERRRIVGEFTMTLLDQILARTYPDTIEVAFSNFDSHGYTIDPYLELEHPEHKGYRINVPYRCLLPTGLDGILVGGLGISVHRDAVPMTRMQPDIQNQGYAAGAAAAMAAKANVGLREIDLRALQKHLIEIGNLPESVLTDKDSFPLPPEQIAAAVESVKDGFKGVAVILTHPKPALPLLREAYAKAEGKDKLTYAQLLAVLGDDTGLKTLVDEVRHIPEWDKGWNYRSMGQFGRALSHLDQMILALGRTRNPQAVPAILDKAKLLTPESDFSHHRSVALALEMIGARTAAPPLAGMLMQPGMTGYVHNTVDKAREFDQESPGGTNAVDPRRLSIRELSLARALYHCGDYGGVGKQILSAYTEDLRGHFARHAKAVLEKAAGAKDASPATVQP
jgi:flavin-dependent dehydrogenase